MKYILLLSIFINTAFSNEAKLNVWTESFSELIHNFNLIKNKSKFDDLFYSYLIHSGIGEVSAKKSLLDIKNQRIKVRKIDEKSFKIVILNGNGSSSFLIERSEKFQLSLLVNDKKIVIDVRKYSPENVLRELQKKVGYLERIDFISKAHANVLVAGGTVILVSSLAVADIISEWGLLHSIKKGYLYLKLGGRFCCELVDNVISKIKEIEEDTYKCVSDLTKVFDYGLSYQDVKMVETPMNSAEPWILDFDHFLIDMLEELSPGQELYGLMGESAKIAKTCLAEKTIYKFNPEDNVSPLKVENDKFCTDKFNLNINLFEKHKSTIKTYLDCMRIVRNPKLQDSQESLDLFRNENRSTAKEIVNEFNHFSKIKVKTISE